MATTHYYVSDCVDAAAQRQAAIRESRNWRSVLHLHEYTDNAGDGCALREPELHEIYEQE